MARAPEPWRPVDSAIHHTFSQAAPQTVQTAWDFGIMVPRHME
jgi:hypothetical protein